MGRIKDCSIAHSQGTADSAVRDLLLLPVGFQWVNLEEVGYLRLKTSLFPKSVLGCFSVWLSCFFWEIELINSYFLNEWQTGKNGISEEVVMWTICFASQIPSFWAFCS